MIELMNNDKIKLTEIEGAAYMSSKDIAEFFNKDHRNVTRDIAILLKSLDGSDLSDLLIR